MTKTFEVAIDAVVPGGYGRFTLNQKHVRVLGGLAGERVVVSVDSRKGKQRYAQLRKVIEPSVSRVAPVCAVAHRCGGCALMHADLERQREIKRGWVERAVGCEVDLRSAGVALGYRCRARLHVQATRNGPVLGYRSARSAEVISAGDCQVLDPRLQAILPWLATLPQIQRCSEIDLALGNEQLPVIGLHSNEVASAALFRALEHGLAEAKIAGAQVTSGGIPSVIGDACPRTRDLLGEELVAAPLGFTQANEAVNHELKQQLLEMAASEGARVLELFSGQGNLSVELARFAKKLVTVEREAPAVEAARKNLAARGLRAHLVCADAAAHLEGKSRFSPECVVLDPPRAGAGECVAGILRLLPRRVVYVSCHPPSLGRDVRALASGGYAPVRATAFDMFPQTGHVEALVEFHRVAPTPRGR